MRNFQKTWHTSKSTSHNEWPVGVFVSAMESNEKNAELDRVEIFSSHSLGSRKDDVGFWWERLTLFAEGGKADTEFCTYPALPLLENKNIFPDIQIFWVTENRQQHRGQTSF